MDKEYERASQRFVEIMEEDRRRDKRLLAEMMVEAKTMVDKIFKVAIKEVKEGKSNQMAP